ncbi:MAG: hypothetical protein AAF664_17685 [Planctomycetota bacterium]
MFAIKHGYRYPFRIKQAKRLLGDRIGLQRRCLDRPSIVLELSSMDLLLDVGRHPWSLAIDANEVGHDLILRCNRWVLAALTHKRFARPMLSMPNVWWAGSREAAPDASLVLADRDAEPSIREEPRRVRMWIGRDHHPDCKAPMPYPVFPSMRESLNTDSLSHARKQEKHGLLFAGSVHPRYARHEIENYGVADRLTLVDRCHLLMRSTPRFNQFVDLVNTDESPIPRDLWLARLAKTAFWLAAPGVAQPLCHNLSEAMSVGAIPVIEFPNRLFPHLRDGFNAIEFSGADGLSQALERISSMPASDVAKMRHQVVEYFDQYGSTRSWLKRVIADPSIENVSLPVHSENLFTSIQSQPKAA